MRPIRRRLGSDLGSGLLLTIVAVVSVGLNTDLQAPPRFDGAGYAVLGEALAAGRGYREISQPESPRHAHFPPGYPAALAFLWWSTGRSVAAARVFSVTCIVAAVLLAWRWFLTIYSRRLSLILGLALAVNWTWGRVGGAIQSEPFYIFWEFLAVLVAVQASRRGGVVIGILLGFVLAACVLTRHVGLGLAAAVLLDLGLHRRWKAFVSAGLTVVVLILPWVGWLAVVRHNTQAGLLVQQNLTTRIAGQAVFYLQRLPDQITGPVVEVGTVFRRSRAIAVLVNLWAVVATGAMTWGWLRTLRNPRRRLVGLIAFLTLALLLVWPFQEAGRFLIPLVPVLLVGATEGVAHVLGLMGPRRPRDWAAGMVLVVSIPYAAYAIATGRAAAQQRIHADFDAACQWIAHDAARPGLILTSHPGEVFWQTGRQAVGWDSPDPEAIDRLIDRLGIAYLLIDEDRYANAADDPLVQYVKRYPDRVKRVWSRSRGMSSIHIWEISRTLTDDTLGHRDEDIRPFAAPLRARPDDVGIEERSEERVTGQDDLISLRADRRTDVGSDRGAEPGRQPPEAPDAEPWRPFGRERPVTPPGGRLGKLGVEPYGSELRAEQADELLLVELDSMKRVLGPFAAVDRPVRGRDDEHPVGDEDSGTFREEGGRIVDVFDRLERDDHIDRSIGQRDGLGITRSGIEAILPPCVCADLGRDVDSDRARRAGPGESRSPVALTTGNVEHALAAYEVLRETVTGDVLPEDPGMRLLGHHAFRVVDGTAIVTHANGSCRTRPRIDRSPIAASGITAISPGIRYRIELTKTL
jgi:hypothetical protein